MFAVQNGLFFETNGHIVTEWSKLDLHIYFESHFTISVTIVYLSLRFVIRFNLLKSIQNLIVDNNSKK